MVDSSSVAAIVGAMCQACISFAVGMGAVSLVCVQTQLHGQVLCEGSASVAAQQLVRWLRPHRGKGTPSDSSSQCADVVWGLAHTGRPPTMSAGWLLLSEGVLFFCGGPEPPHDFLHRKAPRGHHNKPGTGYLHDAASCPSASRIDATGTAVAKQARIHLRCYCGAGGWSSPEAALVVEVVRSGHPVVPPFTPSPSTHTP